MNPPDIVAALVPVVEAFEALGFEYQIGGSVAGSIYGVPRSTIDVDIAANLRPEHVRPLVDRLQGRYYIDEEMILDGLRRGSSFNAIDNETLANIDVFPLTERPWERETFKRVRRDTLEAAPGARESYFTSAEDLVLHKLECYRAGGGVSERQWSDVLGVLRLQTSQLDMAYLERWAADLGLADLLDAARREAWLRPLAGDEE